MNKIHLTKKEMHTRGGILDELMNNLFDVSILIDADCKIVHISQSSYKDMPRNMSVIGQDITILDNISPFRDVIRTGRASTGLLLEIYGRKCVSNIFPIEEEGNIIGAIGTIVFRNLQRVKRMFAGSDSSGSDDLGEIYNSISRIESGYTFYDFVGEDPTVKDLIEKSKKAAGSNLPILIIGETGTGKEIIAGAIHNKRYNEQYAPYVTINCTAIPENLLESELFGHEKGAFTGAAVAKPGKFEVAAGGDILLDEIGDMSLFMQSKLLRVLESKEFERVGSSRIIPLQAGIIASTNKNLFLLSEEKKFRSDLYYRLNTIELFIPPLRRRSQDIPLLLERFSDEIESKLNLTQSALRLLTGYVWPGNVRQLRNLTQRLAIFYENKQITEEDIAQELRVGQRTYNEAFGFTRDDETTPLSVIENTERSAILIAMRNQKNNISAAARELGLSRGTLYNKLKKYGLDPKG